MITTDFVCIIKWHIATIFWFNENKQWKYVSVKKNLKYLKLKIPSFYSQMFLDLKSFWKSSNLYELLISIIKTGGLFIRFFTKVVTKSSKPIKWKIKK